MSASPVPPGAPLDVDAIEARANAALPAPWEAGAGWVYYCGKYERPTDKLQNVCDDKPTADFIAHCRTDVPALCAEVRRLRAALAEIANDALISYGEVGIRSGVGDSRLMRVRNAARAALAPTGEPGNE